ncbi:MAG TPA: flavodoxin domain-containing protein [Anaerolineales bacterium]|nr:flavodoxin domain-containing protein [Anaerolineales bacterium]
MKALIVYDSLYGNTEVIAQIIKHTLEQYGQVEIGKVGAVGLDQLKGIQVLVVGSPTQRFISTASMKTFLDSIPKAGLKGVQVAAFDTRLTQAEIDKNPPLPFFVRIFGYAARRIASQLKKKGGELVVPPEGFLVEGMKGPLVKGEVERAESWARKLVE